MRGQHVDEEVAVDRRPREEREADGGEQQPVASGVLMPKRITSLAERPIENAPMIRFAGRKASPTCSGL